LFVDGIEIPISTTSVIVAFAVSFLVGLIFGMLPANRASRLNPTEALRYE
jgi:putative ABC transport system permease protein